MTTTTDRHVVRRLGGAPRHGSPLRLSTARRRRPATDPPAITASTTSSDHAAPPHDDDRCSSTDDGADQRGGGRRSRVRQLHDAWTDVPRQLPNCDAVAVSTEFATGELQRCPLHPGVRLNDEGRRAENVDSARITIESVQARSNGWHCDGRDACENDGSRSDRARRERRQRRRTSRVGLAYTFLSDGQRWLGATRVEQQRADGEGNGLCAPPADRRHSRRRSSLTVTGPPIGERETTAGTRKRSRSEAVAAGVRDAGGGVRRPWIPCAGGSRTRSGCLDAVSTRFVHRGVQFFLRPPRRSRGTVYRLLPPADGIVATVGIGPSSTPTHVWWIDRMCRPDHE